MSKTHNKIKGRYTFPQVLILNKFNPKFNPLSLRACRESPPIATMQQSSNVLIMHAEYLDAQIL